MWQSKYAGAVGSALHPLDCRVASVPRSDELRDEKPVRAKDGWHHAASGLPQQFGPGTRCRVRFDLAIRDMIPDQPQASRGPDLMDHGRNPVLQPDQRKHH